MKNRAALWCIFLSSALLTGQEYTLRGLRYTKPDTLAAWLAKIDESTLPKERTVELSDIFLEIIVADMDWVRAFIALEPLKKLLLLQDYEKKTILHHIEEFNFRYKEEFLKYLNLLDFALPTLSSLQDDRGKTAYDRFMGRDKKYHDETLAAKLKPTAATSSGFETSDFSGLSEKSEKHPKKPYDFEGIANNTLQFDDIDAQTVPESLFTIDAKKVITELSPKTLATFITHPKTSHLLNAQNISNNILIHYAAEMARNSDKDLSEKIKILVEAGSDLTAENIEGETPLARYTKDRFGSAGGKKPDIIALLTPLERGINLEQHINAVAQALQALTIQLI